MVCKTLAMGLVICWGNAEDGTWAASFDVSTLPTANLKIKVSFTDAHGNESTTTFGTEVVNTPSVLLAGLAQFFAEFTAENSDLNMWEFEAAPDDANADAPYLPAHPIELTSSPLGTASENLILPVLP